MLDFLCAINRGRSALMCAGSVGEPGYLAEVCGLEASVSSDLSALCSSSFQLLSLPRIFFWKRSRRSDLGSLSGFDLDKDLAFLSWARLVVVPCNLEG